MAKSIPSPIGIARYPHITKPDEIGQYADGKFKTKLVVPKKDAAELVETLKTMAAEKKVKKLPFEEEDGNIVFTFKSKFKPLIFDYKNKEVEKVKFRVGGGSRIRCGFQYYVYDKGISLQLKSVQVLDLVSGNESIFDVAEGSFDADELEDDESASNSGSSFPANELDI